MINGYKIECKILLFSTWVKRHKSSTAKGHKLGERKANHFGNVGLKFNSSIKYKLDSGKEHKLTAKEHKPGSAGKPKISSTEVHVARGKDYKLGNADIEIESFEAYKPGSEEENKQNTTADKLDAYPRVKLTIYNVTDRKTNDSRRRIDLSIIT